MALIVSTNYQYQKSNVPTGFTPVVIDSIDSAFEIVGKYDWTPAIFRDGHRSVENFIESVCVAFDIDNTGEHTMSIEEFKKEFNGYEWFIFTSRNHQKEKRSGKNVYPAADRFHAVFPLDYRISSPNEYREFIEAMATKYPCIDKGAKDGARFFYGANDTQVFHGSGKSLKKPTIVKNVDKVSYQAEFTDDKRKEEVFSLLQTASREGCFDNREDWIECGMAMKASGLTFEQWMELSWDTERSNADENQKRWNGFRADRHSMGTLVRFARMADPGFMVKKTYSSETKAADVKETATGENHFLEMPWQQWYQPHVDVVRRRDPETKEFFEVHKPKATIENLEAMLKFYRIEVRENLMSRDIEFHVPGVGKKEGRHANASDGTIRSLCSLNGYAIGSLDQYILTIGHKNQYHPVKNWLLTLPDWDGVDRVQEIIDTILDIEYIEGCEKLPSIIITKWLISCVAAVLEKHYRGRGVLTFHGRQEAGKTSFFRSIIPAEHINEWFKDGLKVDTENKDSIKNVVSHWIVELGEVEGMFKKEIASLKAFITSDEDIMRLPYERKVERFPRRTIMCASVNDPNFLTDPTGSTRFWVLTAKNVKYSHSLNIEQLWAQALYMYQNGHKWWLEGDERDMLARSNAEYYEIDPYEELLKTKYDLSKITIKNAKLRPMLTTEIAMELGFRADKKDVKGVSQALRKLGVPEGYCPNRSKGYMLPQPRIAEEFGESKWRA